MAADEVASQILGFKELSARLNKMAPALAGKVIRSAALSAMLPAVRAAQSAAPVGNPPYESGDPYPVTSYKGRLRTPGFASRNIARKAKVARNGVAIFLGVKPEAFYAIQFIEFGHGNNPRRPWLEPAFRSSIPAIDARFRERLKTLIDKAAK